MTKCTVMLDASADDDQVAAVEAVVRDAGYDAKAEASLLLQGEALWVVLLTIPPVAFLTGFASEAGKDAWKALKGFFERVRDARGEDHSVRGHLMLRPNVVTRQGLEQDEQLAGHLPGFAPPGDTAMELTISTDMPPEAFRALFEFDWSEFEGTHLYWDAYRKKWRTEPKG